MDRKKIKEKANQLVLENKQQIIRVMSIIVVINLIPSLFEGFDNTTMSMLAGIVSILCITFYHGYVVSGLKIARHNTNELTDDDAYVGIRRFKDLFSTYIIKRLIEACIIGGVAIGLGILCLLILVAILDVNVFNYLSFSTYQMNGLYSQGLADGFVVLLLLLVFIVVVVLVALFVEAYLFAVPYLLEKYHMTNMQAIKESYAFMKGYVKDYIFLQLSYLGWMFLVVVIDAVCTQLFSFIPGIGSVVASLIAGIVGVYLYTPQYYTSLAIFFEEIAYRRNGGTQENHTTYEQGENVYEN